jgi:hypothetical protein
VDGAVIESLSRDTRVSPGAWDELRGRAPQFSFTLATPADDADVRRLLRENPTGRAVSVSLEREPDTSLAAGIEGDEHHTIIARDRDTGGLAAVGAVAVRDVYVNGRVTRIGYLGQLRLDKAYAGRASILKGGYAFLRALHPSLGVRLYLTSIFSDNARAKRFLERGLPGMPTYRPVESFETLLMPVAKGIAQQTGSCEFGDVSDCLDRNGRRYQFHPACARDDLRSPQRSLGLSAADFHRVIGRDNGVRGCLAVWDQRPFKQVVVRGYSPLLSRTRPLVNLLGALVGVPPLPAVGEQLDVGYVSHLAIDDDDPEIFEVLLRAAHADAAARDLRYLVVGFARRHPLLAVAKRLYRHRVTASTLYAVHWDDGAADAAALDPSLVAHPEVAIL